MFVAPEYEIEEVWQESFWDKVGGAVLDSVLMEHEHIEPLVLVLVRTQKLDLDTD